MPTDPAYRHALRQRLQAAALDVTEQARANCLQWQQLRIHCGVLSLAKPPRTAPDLEINSPWLPPQSGNGFALLVAGQPGALEQARPLLDALALQPGAWLYCGPLGAASFCRRAFDLLFYLSGPLLLQQLPQPDSKLIDWPTLLLQQQELLQQLAALCQDYLQQQGAAPITEQQQWQLLDEFRQPPARQQHFALNLARLLLLANELGENARQLLDTALDGMAAATGGNSPP
ncbi:hypothetical protein [Vogesella sp. LIG4]|uniref:hypothetical protein n=1 Tax=Vogesella sp. LIG4 TaxID=1192162 RepID=UPI00081FDCF6|nr:hypothetical protein [Vogesella sp. LIG4]SCK18010.1 hypothetical protein PSELUDRAFT_1929 [Vogesella sp. LIG4]